MSPPVFVEIEGKDAVRLELHSRQHAPGSAVLSLLHASQRFSCGCGRTPSLSCGGAGGPLRHDTVHSVIGDGWNLEATCTYYVGR